MGNPVGDFMKNWLNTTYDYLKQTGGPTYPIPPAVTVGAGVLPTGPYSPVEDYPVTYGYVPLPFNQNATGIPATDNSRFDLVEEEAKQNPPPTVFSKTFALLFGDSMAACIADQRHRACNPNTIDACRSLAERGDSSGMILMPNQKDALGIVPPSQENNKPDDARLNENSLTGQIGEGAENLTKWVAWAANAGKPPKDPDDNGTAAGANFNTFYDKLKGFVPGMPDVPGANTGSIVMIGGGIVLIILLIAVIK